MHLGQPAIKFPDERVNALWGRVRSEVVYPAESRDLAKPEDPPLYGANVQLNEVVERSRVANCHDRSRRKYVRECVPLVAAWQ